MDKSILSIIQTRLPGKTIMKIMDYKEKGVYVVFAVPKDRVNEAKRWMNGLYSIDKETYKIVGGFNPMMEDTKAYKNMVKNGVIYERTK